MDILILSKEVKLGFVSALTLSHVHFYWLNPWFTLLPDRQCGFFSNQVITAINPNLRKVGKYYYCWFICCPVSICSPNVFLIYHSFWINSKPLVAKLINVTPYVKFTSLNPLTWNEPVVVFGSLHYTCYISLYTEKTLIDTSQHGVIFPGSGISKAPFRCVRGIPNSLPNPQIWGEVLFW